MKLIKKYLAKLQVKFAFSKKATKIDKIFTVDLTLHTVKLTVKILSIFVAFLEKKEL